MLQRHRLVELLLRRGRAGNRKMDATDGVRRTMGVRLITRQSRFHEGHGEREAQRREQAV
jgi:hypothetical protein